MSFDYLMGYIMSISMCMQNFSTIFHSFQEIRPFSLLPEFEPRQRLGQSKFYHLTISWATSCQYQCVCKIWLKYSKPFKSYRHFSRTGRRQNHFFRIWTSATPRLILNDIWQFLGLHLVNINAYAKFYQNIPNGLRVIDIFHEQASVKIFTNCLVTKSNVWL